MSQERVKETTIRGRGLMASKFSTHKRYVSVKSTEFIAFNDEKKLRYHAVEHFMDTTELEVWKNYVGQESIQKIFSVSDQLTLIGCPYKKDTTLPKYKLCLKCEIFSNCSSRTEITELEKEYCEIIKQILDGTLEFPRYVIYTLKKQLANEIQVLNSNRAKIVGALMDDKITYNVKTAHVIIPLYRNKTWKDILKDEVEEIKSRSVRGQRDWFTEKTWGIGNVNMEDNRSRRRKRRLPPYDRSASNADWKKYQLVSNYGEEYEC
jgi:hypothetical protein